MKNETEEQKLSRLKKKYQSKYLTPLLFKFTRPPIMYDREQVALVKQVDGTIEKLAEAYLCQNCNGMGVTFRKNEMILQDNPPWHSPFISNLIDDRLYANDLCFTCLGEGIVFSKDNKRVARNGLIVNEQDINELRCDRCQTLLYWSLKFEESHCFYFASCCKIEYKLFPELFKTEVKRGL